MTAHALIQGQLYRAPEQRISKAGKPFATATIKVKDGEAMQWWKIVAFSEAAIAELMRLSDGDALSCQGAMKAELYQPEGKEPRVNLSIIADAILPLRRPRERRARERSGGESYSPRSRRETAPERPAGAPANWRAREGLKRSTAAQASNGGMRSYPGETHAELNDEVPW